MGLLVWYRLVQLRRCDVHGDRASWVGSVALNVTWQLALHQCDSDLCASFQKRDFNSAETQCCSFCLFKVINLKATEPRLRRLPVHALACVSQASEPLHTSPQCLEDVNRASGPGVKK